MKYLYLRYFLSKEDTTPHNSDRIGRIGRIDNPMLENSVMMYAENIVGWMTEHPEGKTDIVVMD